jgi:hypothetical protein
VSTKIPFKGTSKEYIGDDKGELHKAVKQVLTQCCLQLKKRIATAHAARERADRKKNMIRYVPDVARAMLAVLAKMNNADEVDGDGAEALGPRAKRPRLGDAFENELTRVGGVAERILAAQVGVITLARF